MKLRKYDNRCEVTLDFQDGKIISLPGFEVPIDDKTDDELLEEAEEYYRIFKAKIDFMTL